MRRVDRTRQDELLELRRAVESLPESDRTFLTQHLKYAGAWAELAADRWARWTADLAGMYEQQLLERFDRVIDLPAMSEIQIAYAMCVADAIDEIRRKRREAEADGRLVDISRSDHGMGRVDRSGTDL